MNTCEYMVKHSIDLLDLYRIEVGMNEQDYTFMRGLLNTAFQEGKLYQLQLDLNRLNVIENEQDNIVRNLC